MADTFEDIVKRSNKKNADVMNIDLIIENIDKINNDVYESEGSNSITAAAELMRMMKNANTKEERIQVVTNVMTRIMAGEKVFSDQPDPQNFVEDFENRFFGHARYMTELLDFCQAYGKNTVKTENQLGTDLGDVPNYADIKKQVFKNVYEKPDPDISAKRAKYEFAAWNKHWAKVNDENSEISKTAKACNVTAAKQVMYLKGVKVLKEIAERHFEREKPGFFARIFRTKAAREYAAERKAMNEVAQNLGKANKNDMLFRNSAETAVNIPVNFNRLLDKATFREEVMQYENALHYTGAELHGNEERIFGEVDAQIGYDNKVAEPEKIAPEAPAPDPDLSNEIEEEFKENVEVEETEIVNKVNDPEINMNK